MYKWTLYILIGCCVSAAGARDLNREINLRSGWRFEIGDNPDYAKLDFDDSDWEHIKVSSSWEEQGFPGYDGYAWYRLHLKISSALRDKALYLRLGYIDDVDEVYINGQYLGGSGTFPPEYQSAYNHNRVYHLPHEMLRFGDENVIAVRVYDSQMQGGITGGQVGIYSHPMIPMEINLEGTWRFSVGDCDAWADPDYDDGAWESMRVPGNWENQDYPYHDGYGWYRKTVIIPKTLKSKHMILALGLIDDSDEVYFNGTRIGRTGNFPGEGGSTYYGDSWQKDRFYIVPPHLIQWDKSNTIAVRVFDYQGPGGIYDGPLGLTTKAVYLDYQKNKKSFENIIEKIFRDWD
ncbi:beta galactosidase jelly roll domain-containing protein [bacterium]|nr:beta galactosidase jelly roll domain-containing protein [bacterium]